MKHRNPITLARIRRPRNNLLGNRLVRLPDGETGFSTLIFSNGPRLFEPSRNFTPGIATRAFPVESLSSSSSTMAVRVSNNYTSRVSSPMPWQAWWTEFVVYVVWYRRNRILRRILIRWTYRSVPIANYIYSKTIVKKRIDDIISNLSQYYVASNLFRLYFKFILDYLLYYLKCVLFRNFSSWFYN